MVNYRKISGARLKRLRGEARLTLDGLAEKTKAMSGFRIGNYEQGTRMMGVSTAVELAQILKLGLPPEHTDEEEQLLESYRQNSLERQNTIREVASMGAQLTDTEHGSINT